MNSRRVPCRLMKCFVRTFGAPIVFLIGLCGSFPPAFASEAVKGKEATAQNEGIKDFLHDLLPTAWQKRPLHHFNVITELTVEGRKWRVPTPDQPLRYFASPGKFVQTGWMVTAGEKPPVAAQLEAAMKKALAANGYLPVENERERPDLLLVFTFGSNGTDPSILAEGEEADRLPTSAEELVTFVLRDPALFKDVFDRARFVGGDRFALELKAALDGEISNMRYNVSAQRVPGVGTIALPVNPEGGSPFQIFLQSGNQSTTRHLVELAFHTCYFVVASAFDFRGVEGRQKIPLWQTRMSVDAQGVAMDEVLKPLILTSGAYLGRETQGAVVVEKRIAPEGRVEIGTSIVVEEAKPDAPTEKAKRP